MEAAGTQVDGLGEVICFVGDFLQIDSTMGFITNKPPLVNMYHFLFNHLMQI